MSNNQKGNTMTQHQLKVISLHDAQAECVCGWHYMFTGAKTSGEIQQEYDKHITANYTLQMQLMKRREKLPILKNLRKNTMGTTSFDLKITSMRQAQDFIVYPLQRGENTKKIRIQSHHRVGTIDLENGMIGMSKPRQGGQSFERLHPSDFSQLTPIDLQTLRMFIFTMASNKAGSRHVYCDNSEAINVIS